MARLVPVFGEGFFHITWGTIYYTIVFDYVDLEGDYYDYVTSHELEDKEAEEARRRMQEFMDEEKVIVNGMRTRTIVDSARIVFRGSRRRHSLVFHARIPYEPIDGLNVYEDYYEPETAEYPYTVYWIAQPCGKIRGVETPGYVDRLARGRIVEISISKGMRLDGYEAVEFEAHAEC
ncbi:MAG: hypothetical protein F7C33_04275 [Desulfurococcales archaeon]|nr:hypothetical protein [Desulfurococcales archaeon]